MYPASGPTYALQEVALSDLKLTGFAYPADQGPRGDAITGAGGGLVAAGMSGTNGTDVIVYRLGQTAPALAAHDFNSPTQTVEASGIAFSPDGSHVYAITGDGGDAAPTDTFHVLTVGGGTTPNPITLAPTPQSFGNQRVGTYGLSRVVSVRNDGTNAVTIKAIGTSGANARDFFGTTTCRVGQLLDVGASCYATVYFGALGLGARHATLVVVDDSPTPTVSVGLTGTGTEGYYLADSRGGAAGFGDAADAGVLEHALAAPVIGITPTSNGAGFWLLARDGGIFSYGNAKFYGSTGAMRLNKPIVGMAATPSGKGYWLVASDGGIFSFGDAKFHGSTGNIRLARPIVGMAATATGRGYEFVANDGGVFSFGDAHFYGSASRTGARIVGLAGTPTGRGYWMVSSIGQVFRYGDAPGYGDASARGVTDVVGIAGTAPLLPPAALGATRADISSGLVPLTAHLTPAVRYSP
jgi:ribosomal protein L24E